MAAMQWDGPFKDIDPLTWQTIIQIQLKDSEEMAANTKGKQRAGTQTDAQLAMQMYIDDLKHAGHYMKDRRMAQSVASAILQDGALIAETFREEQQAARDREMALSLDARPQRNGGTAPRPGPAPGPAADDSQPPSKKHKKDQKDPWQDPEMLEK
jgi:hypothetical protein